MSDLEGEEVEESPYELREGKKRVVELRTRLVKMFVVVDRVAPSMEGGMPDEGLEEDGYASVSEKLVVG